MTGFGKITDLARANPLGRLIQSAMSAAASAFGVALIAAPCYAVAAPASGASTLASASSTPARQRPATDSASLRPFTFRAQQAALVLSIRRMIQSIMTAAAGACGAALIAAPCYAEAAPASRANMLASTTSASAKQPARGEDAAIRPFRVAIPQAALDDLRKRLLGLVLAPT